MEGDEAQHVTSCAHMELTRQSSGTLMGKHAFCSKIFLESCTDPNVQTLLTFHPFMMTSR